MWWMIAMAQAETVGEAFPPPAGFVRVEGDAFSGWLADRPLRAADVPVRTHDGRTVEHEARVLELPLVPGDLQQCADTAIRLRAEWLRESGGEVSFHATSGDPMPWARWQSGERPVEVKGRLQWVPGTAGGWDAYLAKVFMWAGTRSLSYDTVAAGEPRPGDLLVVPGGPGHAVMLVDVARSGEKTAVLVVEGYMPAQDAHVELGPLAGWWPYEDGIVLDHWTLPASGLRRWR